jgi:uncharacterized protein (DUF1800 family)
MDVDDARHVLRRLAFAATPDRERRLRRLSTERAVAALIAESRQAPIPVTPAVVRGMWINTALRTQGMAATQSDARRATQATQATIDIEEVRRAWLLELNAGPAPVRENLVLFLHGIFGTATATVDIPHALHGYVTTLRRGAFGTVPALLESLVLDPAMMIQIGMDAHGRDRVSDRPAKLILDNWTVGADAYADADVEHLSRAITGWTLAAAGPQPAVDPSAPRAQRRTGLVPTFNQDEFDSGAKTILGTTRAFDARSAIGFLARHPATARRFSRLLIKYFGVEDGHGELAAELTGIYLSSDGSIEAMLTALASSRVFYSSDSRWSLVKSPVHLVAAACRQLQITAPPLDVISRWASAAGQTLFDTPNAGEGTWPGGEAWMTPPDRLLVRYQLPTVLGGHLPAFGLAAARSEAGSGQPAIRFAPALQKVSLTELAHRLDPAPGVDANAIARAAGDMQGSAARTELIRRVMTTPQYQLA